MYKVDLKILNQITKTLDVLCKDSLLKVSDLEKAMKKGKKISQKIKDEYTQIKN
jgi:hypothetical protein